MFGKCSQRCRPGSIESIDWSFPRISTGACGFMSSVSRWLGPPNRYKRMTFFARPNPGNALSLVFSADSLFSSEGNNAGAPTPHRLKPPSDSKSRRVTPSQSRFGLPRTRSIMISETHRR
ncbi:MAG: hypothetical protein FD138_4702 [Planctomycetota bacterium]|nr:MAG: hypothetical protein FD138_4702 [Planctomycetota bacterium]